MEPAAGTELIGDEKCGNCYFFRANSQNLKAGGCREDSIKLVILPGPQGQPAMAGQFPPTSSDLWCGKWRPRWKKGN